MTAGELQFIVALDVFMKLTIILLLITLIVTKWRGK